MQTNDPKKEQRQHIRSDYSRLISFTHYDPKNDLEMPGKMAAIHDLSESGVLIQTAESFDPGDTVDLDIAFEQEKIISAEGEVVHRRKSPEGLYYTGIRFTKIDQKDLAYLRDFVKTQN